MSCMASTTGLLLLLLLAKPSIVLRLPGSLLALLSDSGGQLLNSLLHERWARVLLLEP